MIRIKKVKKEGIEKLKDIISEGNYENLPWWETFASRKIDQIIDKVNELDSRELQCKAILYDDSLKTIGDYMPVETIDEREEEKCDHVRTYLGEKNYQNSIGWAQSQFCPKCGKEL